MGAREGQWVTVLHNGPALGGHVTGQLQLVTRYSRRRRRRRHYNRLVHRYHFFELEEVIVRYLDDERGGDKVSTAVKGHPSRHVLRGQRASRAGSP